MAASESPLVAQFPALVGHPHTASTASSSPYLLALQAVLLLHVQHDYSGYSPYRLRRFPSRGRVHTTMGALHCHCRHCTDTAAWAGGGPLELLPPLACKAGTTGWPTRTGNWATSGVRTTVLNCRGGWSFPHPISHDIWWPGAFFAKRKKTFSLVLRYN